MKKRKVVNKLWLDEYVKHCMDTTNSFDLGPKKAKFDIGWYPGDPFRLFSITIGEVLWDGEVGFLMVAEIQIVFLCVSFTIYPFD